jgi:hypothetical protein
LTWIYAYPAWGLGIVVILCSAALAAGMCMVARRHIGVTKLRDNEACGPVTTVVGTILAVLLSVMLIADWQEYDQAAQTASDEASAAQDLYEIAPLLPNPAHTRLRALLDDYASTVVGVEWPLMRTGRESPLLNFITSEITGTIVGFEPKTPQQAALQSQALRIASTLSDSRQIRLFDNRQGIPMILWGCIGFLVFVTLMMCSAFAVRNFTMHVVMSASVGVVIAAIAVLIAEFDYPFRGDIQLPPTAWHHVTVGLKRNNQCPHNCGFASRSLRSPA